MKSKKAQHQQGNLSAGSSVSHRCAPERDCRVKVEEASVRFFLRKQSPFPLGSTTEPEFVLRKPGGVKITAYKRQRVALGCWPQHLQELSHSSAWSLTSVFSSSDHFFHRVYTGGKFASSLHNEVSSITAG